MEKYTKEQLEKKLDELFEQNELSQDDLDEQYFKLSAMCYMRPMPSFLQRRESKCGRCGKIYDLKQDDFAYSKDVLRYKLMNEGVSAEVEFYCDDCIKESGGKKGQLRYKKDGATDWDTIELDDETIEQLMCYCKQDNNGDDK